MTIESQLLLGAAFILFALLSIQGTLAPLTHGLRWGLGPRDEARTPSVLQGRMNRIVANHLEGLAMFAPLILVAHLAGVSTPLTQSGAALFVVSRALFAVVYAFGIPVLRSLVWGASVAGLIMIAAEVVRAGF
jgi:uncharacterized MAPEG superfamily protein